MIFEEHDSNSFPFRIVPTGSRRLAKLVERRLIGALMHRAARGVRIGYDVRTPRRKARSTGTRGHGTKADFVPTHKRGRIGRAVRRGPRASDNRTASRNARA
jgi:hypothetical protein